MAGVEWGLKGLPTENRRLKEVTRFQSHHLLELEEKISSFNKNHPGVPNDEAVAQMEPDVKPRLRMLWGLHILDQLHLVGRSGKDVNSVIVREDQNRQNGINHLWYEIDWIKAPDKKQSVKPAQVTRSETIQPRAAREVKTAARERQAQETQMRAERKEIDRIVIDGVKELGDASVNIHKIIGIELGEDNKAQIFFNGQLVDRVNGQYRLYDFTPDYYGAIKPELLDYYNVLAQQLEGGEVSYRPRKLDLQVCQDIFDRAVRAGMIQIKRDSQKGVIFLYSADITNLSSFLQTYSEMDLEKNVVTIKGFIRTTHRPIHPDFSEFLRQKKTELESTTF